MEQVLTEAATSAIPDKVMSLWHRFTKSKESLTRTEHITCFNALYGNLKTFCSPEMNHSLPPKIAVCWSVFNFEVVNALDYHFTNMVDLQQLLTTVRQENTYTHPVTTSILSTFDGINALASSETKTLVQVTLGYVAAVAIELARIEDSTQQTAIIVHLERVITTLHANTEYRNIAGEQVSKALNALLSVFKDFLTNHQAKERIERITNAVKAFLKNQIELVTLLLQVLLIATEGGNKQKLTFDCVKIKKGELTNADNPARFNPSNPFQPLISYTAGWIPNLHGGQNSGQEPLKTLELPTIEVIQNFLATALNHGFLIKEQRVHYGDDTVLYLLERSNNTWITKTDAIAITQSAKQLHRLADWLRFHLYIADKLYHLNILLIMQGQAWFAQGAEATFIQLFIQRYNTLFQKFTNEIGDIHTFLSDRAGSNVGPEHNIFYTFNKIEEISKTLQENALTHLLKVQEHFSSIRGIADESRQRFFSDLTFFLNDSGYQFELPPYEEILSNPLTIMPLPQTSTPVQLQCTTVSTHFTPTEKIKHILESYAYQHGYTFKLDNIADEIRLTPGSPNEFQLTSSHSGETHEVRAQWILECLKLFTPEKTVQELLEAMAQKIKTLQLGLKKYSHFKSKLGGKTDIEKCIEEIITEIEKSVITKPTLPPNGSAPANSLPTSAQNAAASPTTTSSLSTNSVSNSKEPSLMPQSLAPSPVIQPCNQTSKGYHRHRVPGDGDCGYTAYGITREAAYSLLKTKKADSSIHIFIKLAIKETLLLSQHSFYKHLLEQKIITKEQSLESIVDHLETVITNQPLIIDAFLDFDLRDKKVENGWAHPAILQALAHIQKIEIHLWHLGEYLCLVPHALAGHYDYASYTPPGSLKRIDILFTDNNHFDKLSFVGFNGFPPPAEVIFPFKQNVAIIEQLEKWLNHYVNDEPDMAKKESFFTQFWKPLCYLEGKKFFIQTRNHESFSALCKAEMAQQVAKEGQQLLLEAKTAHADPTATGNAWANDFSLSLIAAHSQNLTVQQKQDAAKKALETAVQSSSNALTSVQKKVTSVTKKLHLKTEEKVLCAWDEKTNDQLTIFLATRLMINDPNKPSFYNKALDAPLFLRYMSQSLLRRTRPIKKTINTFPKEMMEYQEEMASFNEETAQLDKLLSTMLDQYGTAMSTSSDKTSYLSCIIQGLISLGANPLDWMESKMKAETATVETKKATMASFRIMTEYSSLIISSLILRTEYLGDCSALLRSGELSAYLKAIQTVGDRLFRCLDTDEAWWYLKKMGTEGDARNERAKLFFIALKEAYTILNEQLSESEADLVKETAAFSEVKVCFATASQEYAAEAKKAGWFTNNGFKAWEALEQARTEVYSAMTIIFTRARQQRATLLNTKKITAQNMVLELKNEDLTKEKEAMAVQLEVSQAQEAAQRKEKLDILLDRSVPGEMRQIL